MLQIYMITLYNRTTVAKVLGAWGHAGVEYQEQDTWLRDGHVRSRIRV